jgi:DNA-binding transcriptional ArsR family regulator
MTAPIAPQTASSHLSKLVSGRLLAVEQQARYRYYRLANISLRPRYRNSSIDHASTEVLQRSPRDSDARH